MASMSHFIRAVPIKIDDRIDHFQPKTNIFVPNSESNQDFLIVELVVCGKTCSSPDNCGLGMRHCWGLDPNC